MILQRLRAYAAAAARADSDGVSATAVARADSDGASATNSDSEGSRPSSSSSESASGSRARSRSREAGSSESASESGALRLRRRAQTEKARAAAAKKRYAAFRQRVEAEQDQFLEEHTRSRAQTLQEQLFTRSFARADVDLRTKTRWRGLYSYLKALAKAAGELLVCSQAETEKQVQNLVCVQVVDDCNIRMAEPNGSSSIFTVMNAIQSITLRRVNGLFEYFRIHQPMVSLPDATANSLHICGTAWFLCCAAGVGRCLRAIGFPSMQDIKAKYCCSVWVTDSLKTNLKVFNEEREQLARLRTSAASMSLHVGLHMTCCIHKLSLIRRPLVLIPRDYWSNVVRLAHLFESRSFKKRFEQSLAHVVLQSFKRRVVHELLAATDVWRGRAQQVFGAGEKKRAKYLVQAESLYLQVLNGDPAKEDLIHWCRLGGCPCRCGSDEEALKKALQAFLGLFGRGYPVPLLQRWKHYGSASAFICQGRSLNNIVPRVLGHMASGRPVVQSDRLDALLAEAAACLDIDAQGAEELREPLEGEMSFAEQNNRRLKKVLEAMGADTFADDASLVAIVCRPIDWGMNELLARTARLERLRTGMFLAAESFLSAAVRFYFEGSHNLLQGEHKKHRHS